MLRLSARLGLVVFISGVALCQPAAKKPAFDIADAHVSPRSNWVKKPATSMQGGLLNAGRYELRRATMLDLIRIAYAVDADKIYGGPSWLDYDRFEIAAKAPAGTRPDALRLMLRSLLEERFKLVVKPDTRAVPAYVLSVAKDKPKLKPAEGSSSSGCQNLPPTMGTTPTGNMQCRDVSLETFAAALRRNASVNNLPVVDSTGVEGTWDIDLQYPLRVVSANTGAVVNGDGSLFDSIEKQLGLKLELSKAPQPVLVVESVNEQPTTNAPGVAASLPPLPAPQLEVASIRSCDGTGPTLSPRFEPGGRVTARCMPLLLLITQVWGMAPFEKPVGVPKWMESNSTDHNISITGKAPEGTFVDAQGRQDQDALNAMIRALLIDRYKMKFHYEDRPMDAYTLVAVKPKLTKADPANRTGCTRQTPSPGPGGLALRLVCQNITMAQFVEQVQGYDSNVFYPVLDGTGIEGAWDFTLNYNPLANIPLPPILAARGGNTAPSEAADPSGAISFADAVEKQLGLKLEMHKRPEPVMVLDHIEEQPTEN